MLFRSTVEAGTLKIAPAGVTSLTATLYTQPSALTVENPTSTILTAYPMLYLSATLFEGFTFLQNEGAAAGHLARFRAQVEGANKVALSRRILSGSMALRFEPIG